MKKNCWEVKKCGREAGGAKQDELGVCLAANEKKLNGLHGGINGGRVCWAIAGTLCKGIVRGDYAKKMEDCTHCKFYEEVHKEEGKDFLFVWNIFKKMDSL